MNNRNRIACFFIVLLLVVLSVGTVPTVAAMNTGFSTAPIAEERRQAILSDLKLYLLTEEPPKDSIRCFDVNEAGVIALGLAGGSPTICVYDQSVFQYGYRFVTPGDFELEWDGDHLLLYLVRGNIVVELTPQGKGVAIEEIQDIPTNKQYWRQLDTVDQCTVGDTVYSLEKGIAFFEPSYSQVIAVNAAGEKTILYDVSCEKLPSFVMGVIVILLLIGVVVLVVVRSIANAKQYIDVKDIMKDNAKEQ